MNLNFKKLQESLTDVIAEQQIKLGFLEETVYLYYPEDTLMQMLQIDENLEMGLQYFIQNIKIILGDVTFTQKNGRYCFKIPPEGVVYVHEHYKKNGFLEEFIQLIKKGTCTIQEIVMVFQKYGNHVICSKMKSQEFDYVIYFEDGIPDQYRYCINIDHMHTHYHRFTIQDYQNLIK